ncbi:hypothetical protein ACFWP2_09110 [Kitasatospora sp. NPDC058444]|uniref:hypothetical protein n=1 Tax=Kitasatospora sp. NPDC058444 TaxID=3346504 RepID=UPI003665424F
MPIVPSSITSARISAPVRWRPAGPCASAWTPPHRGRLVFRVFAALAEFIRELIVAGTGDRQAMASLAFPVGGQQWPPAGDVFARVCAAGGGR